jgi:hypothetical protein
LRVLIIFTLICVSVVSNAIAQSLRYSIAMPYTSLAAYSTQQKDALSFTGNQAALAATKQAGVGVYGERRFLLASTSYYTLAAAVPTKMGNFGVQLNYSGFKNFNENKIGLAYARSLGAKVDIGVQFNYYGYRIPGYNAAATINFEAGAIFHFSDKLNGGIHVYNPVGGKLGKGNDEKLASAYKIGLGYDASENFFVSAEMVKEEDMPVNVVAGVQYQFAQQFFVRAGFLSASSSAFVGVGAGFNKFRIDIAASYHPQLGFSPGVLFVSNFGTKKQDNQQ